MSDEMEERKELGRVCRQKYWEECGIEEKMERVRVEIKTLQETVNRLMWQVEMLNTHLHHEDKIVLPLTPHVANEIRGAKRAPRLREDKEVYF